jgi:hypothetical protein
MPRSSSARAIDISRLSIAIEAGLTHQSHTTSLQADQEDSDLRVLHEMLDRCVSGLRSHSTFQPANVEPCPLKPESGEIQHGDELRKDERFDVAVLVTQFAELVDQHFQLGRGSPILQE